MTPEDLGNYTYGYIGRYFGFSLEVLLLGSYYAAGYPKIGMERWNEDKDQYFVSAQ